MGYLRRAGEFLSEHESTIERVYAGGVCVPLGVYWEGYFLSETIRIGQDFLYSSNVQETVNRGIELLAGGTMTGLVALCVVGAALLAKRGPVEPEEQPQEQNP